MLINRGGGIFSEILLFLELKANATMPTKFDRVMYYVTIRINPVNFIRSVQGIRSLGAIVYRLVKCQIFKVFGTVNQHPEPGPLLPVKFHLVG